MRLAHTMIRVKDLDEPLAFYTGRWNDAEEYHKRNLEARRATGDVLGAALAGYNLGELYLEAIERTGPGEWLGHTVRLDPVPGAKRREAIRSIIEEEARAFGERFARFTREFTGD